MHAAHKERTVPAFSGEFIRFLIGFIALAFPVIVLLVAKERPLTSISYSYHTEARNIFVGLLFVLGAFLLVYKGRSPAEAWVARFGALAPVIAALFPTNCKDCPGDLTTYIHLAAGAVLFLTAAYFCLGPFKQAAKSKSGYKADRRVRFYTVCGYAILVSLVVLVITKLPFVAALRALPDLTFAAEWIMLWLFAGAWLVASKVIPWFADETERLSLPSELGLSSGDTPKT